MKIRTLGAELFHADGQTYRHDEAKIRFPQFLRTRLKMKFHVVLLLFVRSKMVAEYMTGR